tara:strand:- start:493 stop:750 length:258 start_codon:yes stop_codon:yes gene_type:complete
MMREVGEGGEKFFWGVSQPDYQMQHVLAFPEPRLAGVQRLVAVICLGEEGLKRCKVPIWQMPLSKRNPNKFRNFSASGSNLSPIN